MASPPIKRPKIKTVPLGKPFGWDNLTEEQQIQFGTPDDAFIELAKSRATPQMTPFLDALIKEILEES